MKRRWWAVVLGLTACLAGLFILRPGGSISEESYQKIQVGMTRQDVESTLGGRARQEVQTSALSSVKRFVPVGTEEWWGEDGIVSVKFDAADKVGEKSFEHHATWVERPSLAEIIRSWWR
jgi:hypothetical protein